MKEAKSMYISNFEIYCPYECGGWIEEAETLGDPRGKEFICDNCGRRFKVPKKIRLRFLINDD